MKYYVTKWALTKGIFTIEGELWSRKGSSDYISETGCTPGSGHFLKLGKEVFATRAEAVQDQLNRARKSVESKKRALKKAKELLAKLEEALAAAKGTG